MNEEPDKSLWQGFKGRKCLRKDFKDFNKDVIVTLVVIAIEATANLTKGKVHKRILRTI